MTPDEKAAHKREIEERQAKARAACSKEERDIYEFVRSRFAALGANYDADKDDERVMEETAQKFGITRTEAQDTWAKVDGAGLEI